MCPELRLLNIYIVENALHCKTLYCMKVSLSVSVYITVWVNKGHYLAKSVMQVCGFPNERRFAWSHCSVSCAGAARGRDGATVPTFVHGEDALLADGLGHAVP